MTDERDPEFKVTDRRRRGDDEVPAEVSRPAPVGRTEPSIVGATLSAPSTAGVPPQDITPPLGAEPTDRSLVGLFMMLGAFVVTALGERPPEPGAPPGSPDLEQAAELIDLLALLREKTEGRRSAEEDQVLGSLIYDLQIRYVSVRRQSG
jgi:hypothetical protein